MFTVCVSPYLLDGLAAHRLTSDYGKTHQSTRAIQQERAPDSKSAERN
jgi:hypothetical protein